MEKSIEMYHSTQADDDDVHVFGFVYTDEYYDLGFLIL